MSAILLSAGRADVAKSIATPEVMMEKSVEAYRAKGIPAGIDELQKCFKGITDAGLSGYRLNPYYHKIYKEGQVYSGKLDLEWGIALYRWAYHNTDQYPSSMGQEVFLTNYFWLMRRGGYHGTIRKIQQEWQHRYAKRGFDTFIDLSKPGEAAMPGFPQTRVIAYPGVDESYPTKARFVRDLADQQLADGNWKEALSHFRSIEKITTEKWLGGGSPEVEWMNEVATARMGAAAVLEFLGFHELAGEFHQLNMDCKAGIAYRGRPRSVAMAWKEFDRLRRHEVDGESLRRIDELLVRIPKNMYHLPRSLVMARQLRVMALFELGRAEEAWAGLARLVETHPKNDRIMNYWIQVMIEHGRLHGVEEALLERLRQVRMQGEKKGEIELYFMYADFLRTSSRWNEAARITDEGIRLLRAFDVYTRLPGAYLDLSEIHRKLGNLAMADAYLRKSASLLMNGRLYPEHVKLRVGNYRSAMVASLKPENKISLIELQPRESISVPLVDLPARGLIVLSNNGTEHVEGEVEVMGFHREITGPDENNVYHLNVDPGHDHEKTLAFRVALKPGEDLFFDLAAKVESNRGGSSLVKWTPVRGVPAEAVWKYEFGGDQAEDKAIIDAGVYERNSFHGLPIYHCIQSRDGLRHPMDLRVVASHKTRVELYDESGQLVFVDANGDGDLNDVGDSLNVDENRNGLPDVSSGLEGELSARFLMLVYPGGDHGKEELALTLSYRDSKGEWVKASEDRVVSTGGETTKSSSR